MFKKPDSHNGLGFGPTKQAEGENQDLFFHNVGQSISSVVFVLFKTATFWQLIKVLFTDLCRWQDFCPSLLHLVDRLYTVINKMQKTRTKVLPSVTVSISSGQRNLMKTYHNEANPSRITKLALKHFLDFFWQRR